MKLTTILLFDLIAQASYEKLPFERYAIQWIGGPYLCNQCYFPWKDLVIVIMAVGTLPVSFLIAWIFVAVSHETVPVSKAIKCKRLSQRNFFVAWNLCIQPASIMEQLSKIFFSHLIINAICAWKTLGMMFLVFLMEAIF